ncbi:MAG: hypothetical protein HY820_07305 [Acidobacteria bacterium]|nr:hypothetical protein [Acidobacteriota bacterium]
MPRFPNGEQHLCIALAAAHKSGLAEVPVLDPDFAADVDEIILSRKPAVSLSIPLKSPGSPHTSRARKPHAESP